MKSKLAKTALTAAAALALAGAATPAFAHVGLEGGGGIVASADQPFLAGGGGGVAHTSDIVAGGGGGGAATATDLVGGGEGFAHIKGWK
ncbi:hypothetical protein ACIG0C_25595 [Kitasatospora aureofaciens]|uniref:Uncharacterized protein n=1 Tax=Kitasatospora aureofaciens TaxID=1894 RepID=A0A1E7N696_KITAU|nr:hypothetical protein [Kitasatospora aureofaciens]QEV01037.1 hypothetical protein CP971_18885 [Streptomyces viridifaciens]ARF79811.1 hypothetical protein B6264_13665 [Kitasatospora aureofaciens]OEV36198.1 hypothetical protein HS99_0030610 [Kitasatospora aureofaciens]UKZ07378.1 hypothetical protein BOQ63_025760 [Streptomyces viridifaciens]GGU86762.1 hypothetical protein GCM10010502_43770 [Kitasatospora aureofaciens]